LQEYEFWRLLQVPLFRQGFGAHRLFIVVVLVVSVLAKEPVIELVEWVATDSFEEVFVAWLIELVVELELVSKLDDGPAVLLVDVVDE
jgi:hypothetical protein